MKSQQSKKPRKLRAAKTNVRVSRSKRTSKSRVAEPQVRTGKARLKPAPQETKHSSMIGLLRSANGASVAELVGATGWQSHSVRGFLAGVVRKKLRLDLGSQKVDGIRRYFIGKK